MKGLFGFILLLILVGFGGLFWWTDGTAPVDKANTQVKLFTVEKGNGPKAIAANLQSEGLIKNAFAFYLLVKESGVANKIQAGEFQLSPSYSSEEILQKLQTATKDKRITIPEGKRAEEIADILQKNFPQYNDSWRQLLVENEGYLFPDTYQFSPDADIQTIIGVLKSTFEKKYASLPHNSKSTYSREEIVTIASMVEREAKFDQDRQLVASVIINRLELGMPLQIDATIQYAIGTPDNWWPQLTDKGGNIVPNSSYNTYTHSTIPPTPISNPGKDTLQAVINPPQTGYLYYISDKQGFNHYAKTLAEHEANIKKYGL